MTNTPELPELSEEEIKSNPLIQPSKLPFKSFPFEDAKFEHYIPAARWAIGEAQKRLDAIKAIPVEEATFENTIEELTFCDEELKRVLVPFGISVDTATHIEEFEEIEKTIDGLTTDFYSPIFLDKELFARVQYVFENIDKDSLTTEQKVLLDKTYYPFYDGGINLEGAEADEFIALKKRLSELRTTYKNNAAQSADKLAVVISKDEAHLLDGVPESDKDSYLARAKGKDDLEEGSYLIPLIPPPVGILYYANDRDLRQRVYEARGKIANGGDKDNNIVALEILNIRQRMATLLGYENHADKTINERNRMSAHYSEVMEFVENNAEIYYPQSQAFADEIAAYAKAQGLAEPMEPWDFGYYLEKYTEEKVGLKTEDLKQYLEVNNCLDGLFNYAENLYGVKFKETEEGKYQKWHQDVRVFEMLDPETDEIKALFFLDTYAREGKRGGAWMNDMRGAGLHNGQQEIPIIVNFLNVNKPSEGKPSLFDDDDIETLYHEFGHGIHGMSGEGTYPSLSGVNSTWDYVELPSQNSENWGFKKAHAKTYALHHETSEPIPDKMLAQLDAKKEITYKWQCIRQAQFGLLDMKLHTTDPEEITDLLQFERDLLEPYSTTEIKHPQSVNFGHLFAGGYSAGYYVYKWADALVADVHERFLQAEARGEGIYPEREKTAYMEHMIKPGGTVPAAQMLANFKQAVGCNDTSLDSSLLYKNEGFEVPDHLKRKIG